MISETDDYDEKDLAELGYTIDSYAGGFMIERCDEEGNCKYTGCLMIWSRQPIIQSPFRSKEDAVEAINKEIKERRK